MNALLASLLRQQPLERNSQVNRLLYPLFVALLLCGSGRAQATDGCKVALCIAGNWRNISQCRPEVEQAMRDVARGHSWPSCDMGSGNGAVNTFVDPRLCPVQYRYQIDLESGSIYRCQFSSVVDVVIAGQPWTRIWWSPGGDSVTEWMPAARIAFAKDPSAMDSRFDSDYAAWLANQSATSAGSDSTGGNGL